MVSSGIVRANSTEAVTYNQAQKTSSASGDFASLFTQSVSRGSELSFSSKADIKNTASSDNASGIKDTKPQTDNKLEAAESKTDSVSRSDETKDKEALMTTDTAGDETKSRVEEAAKDIADTLKKELKLTDEELSELMAFLNINMTDLLSKENVIAVIVEATGASDAMELLMNQEYAGAIKELMAVVETKLDSLSEELNIPEDELMQSIKDMHIEADAAGKLEEGAFKVGNEELPKAVEDKTEIVEDKTEADNITDILARKLTVKSSNDNSTESGLKNGFNDNSSGKSLDKSELGTQNPNMAQSGIVNIANSFTEAITQADVNIRPVDIVNQVIDAIKLEANNTLTSIEVALNPENLGKVNVLVTVREGVVTAQLSAENEQVKKALEGQILTLKEHMLNQGIKIEAVEVTVHSNSLDMANQQENMNRQKESAGSANTHRRLRLDFPEDELSDEPDSIISENSSVEYSA